MRLADPLLQRGVKVFDISFWKSTPVEALHRLGRETHYPPVIDVLDPYLLLSHQGMVESLFLQDMKLRGRDIHRNVSFDSYEPITTKLGEQGLQVSCTSTNSGQQHSIFTQYLIGCKSAVTPDHRQPTSLTRLFQATAHTPESAKTCPGSRPSASHSL
jgi:hypothetical protein